MLKRHGEEAHSQSATRANELAAERDQAGAVTRRMITEAVAQLAKTTPPGPVH
jgi:hypothetical protein